MAQWQPLRLPVLPAHVALAIGSAVSFVRPTYGAFHPTPGPAALAAVLIASAAAVGVAVSFVRPGFARGRVGMTLVGVNGLTGFVSAVDVRRRVLGLLLGAVLLPVLTVVLTGHPLNLALADELLIYLTAVVAVAVVGGFWPAVVAAVAASLLLNWFFTRPLHTFTIAEPDNLLALLLFVVVAIAVSSVVHVAARRAQQADRSNAEARALSTLAGTVLGQDDSPAAVLRHLEATLAIGAELRERAADRWAAVGYAGDLARSPVSVLPVRDDLQLVTYGPVPADARRLLEAAGSQAAAALDRDRLRTQAAQAEMLAAGNRMRTALLAAVSHDLRTPLASIKASVSSLRQTDVQWSPEDQAALLENVEDATDRLDALIANLLDMSRLHTGSLQPFLAPVAVDEIVPLAVRATADDIRLVELDIPETLPLVSTDAGLVERAVANLLSNALRYSYDGRPPRIVATADESAVRIMVVDHGPGVSAQDRERIFEPFQRLGDQDMTTGVGLGLAVARGFVNAVGGTLTASDTSGGGLTMTITLPAAARAVPVQP
ncbi:MAG: two-component system, OmpR family, sensor histidine kinase KdpD [Frankiaceae bacterium]|nr:two-component system, OmpR family, sensor histidine kinase KdpD [Frankiaceae bacterium]